MEIELLSSPRTERRHGRVGRSSAGHESLVPRRCSVRRLRLSGSVMRHGSAAVRMTQQYLAGELSLLLAQVQAVATSRASAQDVAHLRREAEAGPLRALTSVAARAFELTDGLCWDALDRGDTAAFVRQAAVCAELHEFGVCSGLLDDN